MAVWTTPASLGRLRLVVVRSTWDYTARHGPSSSGRPRSRASRTLRGAGVEHRQALPGRPRASGVPVIETRWLEPGDRQHSSIARSWSSRRWGRAPVTRSATSRTRRRSRRARGPPACRGHDRHGPALPGGGREGSEQAVIFIGGHFTTACARRPCSRGPPRARGAHLGARTSDQALAIARYASPYCRSEVRCSTRASTCSKATRRTGGARAELTEPSLFLSHDAQAPRASRRRRRRRQR